MTETRASVWPVLLLAAPAGVAIWSGWVGLGELAGFGMVRPLPGIADFELNTAITLPIGMECYAAYALRVWLSGAMPEGARSFARRSAIGALVLGALGQVAYHLLAAAGVTSAPWPVTALVACLPVAVLGMGAALAHLIRADQRDRAEADVELGDAQAVRVAAQRELEDADSARTAAGEARRVAAVDLAAADHARDEATARLHATEPDRPVRQSRSGRRDKRPATSQAASRENRRQWVRDEHAAGRDPSGADVDRQFGASGTSRTGAAIVREVNAERSGSLRLVAGEERA